MAAVSKTYGVGDTVWVRYVFPHPEFWLPRSRVVKFVEVTSGTNEAKVTFESGDDVIDGSTQTVYTTQALAAKGVVDDVIAKSVSAVLLDTTTSAASTAGLASTTLARKS